MNPLLSYQFECFKNSYNIDTQNEPLREANAFERFVNYYLFSLDYPDIFTADEELLDLVSVGGGNDNGIDGIGIKINDRLVRNPEDVVDMAELSKKISVEFVFVQSKRKDNISEDELLTFVSGVNNFFNDDSNRLPENVKIMELRIIKDYILNDQLVLSKLDKSPDLSLYYVTTGHENKHQRFENQRIILEEKLKKDWFETVVIKHICGEQLLKYCKELQNRFETQFNCIDMIPLNVNQNEIQRAYACTCEAREFLKIIVKDDGQLRRSLFNNNVRDYLGSQGGVNSEIENSIVEQPDMFLLKNNGITIVCSNFEPIKNRTVKIENPQIVNGCQTSNCLFNLRENENINRIQLLIKFISTEDTDISNSIVRGTNKQNQVLEETFEGTLPFHQNILEPFFAALTNNDAKLYYERRPKQFNDDPLVKKDQIVNLKILTQTFVGIFLDSPHEAHRHEAKLLERYAGKKGNRQIFCDTHGAYPYYTCALIWYKFEKYFRDSIISHKYSKYKAHLYFLFKYSLGEYPPYLNNEQRLETYCRKLLDIIKEPDFARRVKDSIACFDRTLDLWLAAGKNQDGVKDNRDFTNELMSQAKEYFRLDHSHSATDDRSPQHEGTIFNIIKTEERWFGFIKIGRYEDNIYFDNRMFKGDINELYRGVRVRYEAIMGYNGPKATVVEII